MSKLDQDILVSYIIEQLSLEDKTVRDPIHGDILWNHLESCIIDTSIFQRLRRIKQLGTVHFVFPGAEHSRFQHSLGTLHMAKTLISNVRNNRFSQHRVFGKPGLQDKAFELVLRLAALLHDAHEFPLSHTLEKEGNIFERQWKDKTSIVKILGEDGEIFRAIDDYVFRLIDHTNDAQMLSGLPKLDQEQRKSLAKRLTKTLITYSYKIISGRNTKSSEIAKELFGDKDIISGVIDETFLLAGNQIILNTVCADLLDYLPRDFYFCGIKKTYDERFLKYACVSDRPVKKRGKNYPVLAYRLLSKRNTVRLSVLSSLFDVLELRYTLSEVVHTHRTKNAFSVMAIEAFNYFYQSMDDDKREELAKKMMSMGDDELLSYVKENNGTSKYILDYYHRHQPYKECVLFNFRNVEDNPRLSDALSTHIKNPKERLSLQKIIVNILNASLPEAKTLGEGDCLLYMMPDPATLYKELETNVIFSDREGNLRVDTLLSLTRIKQPYALASYPVSTIMERTTLLREHLIKKYEGLWHVSLFLSPKTDFSLIQPLAASLIENLFQVIHYKVSVEAPTVFLNGPIHERIRALDQDHRGFRNFEEILRSLES